MGAISTRVVGALHRFRRRAVTPRLGDPAWWAQARLVAAALALGAFMIRVLGAAWPGQFKIFFPDSFSFLNVAKTTPFSPGFYAGERPIGFPTLLFILGRSTVVTVVVQTFLNGTAYLLAAATAVRLLRHDEARIVCAFLVVTIGIEPRFALWNTHILSESFGMTLAVASVVSWWRFSAQPSRPRLHVAGGCTVAWLTVRDANVPPWLAIGVPALFIASYLWRSADPVLRRALRRWAVATLVVCIGVALAQSANGRNRYATMNNIGLRVLPDPELTGWFEDRGMPLDDALRRRTGFSSFDNNWDMLTSPDLAQFRAWADGSGQREMLISYIRFAPHWIGALGDDLPVLLQTDQSGYDAFGVAKRLPDPPPAQIGGPTTRTGLLAWTAISVVGLALASRRRRVQSIVLGLLLASTFVDLYVSYVGDSVEIQRHLAGPLARMALIMVLCLGVGIDSASELARARKSRPDEAFTVTAQTSARTAAESALEPTGS